MQLKSQICWRMQTFLGFGPHTAPAEKLILYKKNNLHHVSVTRNVNAALNTPAASLWECNRINYRIILVQVTGGRLSGRNNMNSYFYSLKFPRAQKQHHSEPIKHLNLQKETGPAHLILLWAWGGDSLSTLNAKWQTNDGNIIETYLLWSLITSYRVPGPPLAQSFLINFNCKVCTNRLRSRVKVNFWPF